ncbi:MAG: TolC family protein, partial [Verrucomicrobiales bacterium]|nr:TolC family protein [Verrucomicrobiales bacterium]
MSTHSHTSPGRPPLVRRWTLSRFPLPLPLLLLLPAAVAALPTSAQARPFSPDSAAAYAIAHNPDLAVARATLDEARARVLQAGNLANPELETEVRPNLAGREFSAGITYSQRFPLTNRLRLEKALSLAAVKTAEIEIQANARTLAAEVKGVAVQGLSLK